MERDILFVMSMTASTREEAESALLKFQTVEDAIDALLVKPVSSGDKHIPLPPKIDSGLTAEQEERCKKGRWLQDQVNVVFSAAHSKTRTPLDAGDCSSTAAPPSSPSPAGIEVPVCDTLDVDEKTTLADLQSVAPQ
jgi:hypothetical protein